MKKKWSETKRIAENERKIKVITRGSKSITSFLSQCWCVRQLKKIFMQFEQSWVEHDMWIWRKCTAYETKASKADQGCTYLCEHPILAYNTHIYEMGYSLYLLTRCCACSNRAYLKIKIKHVRIKSVEMMFHRSSINQPVEIAYRVDYDWIQNRKRESSHFLPFSFLACSFFCREQCSDTQQSSHNQKVTHKRLKSWFIFIHHHRCFSCCVVLFSNRSLSHLFAFWIRVFFYILHLFTLFHCHM